MALLLESNSSFLTSISRARSLCSCEMGLMFLMNSRKYSMNCSSILIMVGMMVGLKLLT